MKPRTWIFLVSLFLIILAVVLVFLLLKIIHKENPNLSNTERNSLLLNTKISYVDIRDYGFFPSNLTIEKGELVVWKNLGSGNYTINFNNINESSDLLKYGENYTKFFALDGIYDYSCSVNPSLNGRIIVK
jgi:plastocyanin